MRKTVKKIKQYGQFCPVAKSLDVVGDRWTLLIIRDLLRGTKRFKDLQSSLTGIAPNLLSDRLRKLEQAGLVARQLFRELPPKVEYSLTDRGRELETVVRSLARFGMLNLMAAPREDEIVDPELIFQAMPTVFLPERAEGVDALIQVNLAGEEGGTWFVKISPAGCEVSCEATRRPDTVIRTDLGTWAELATGQLEPDEAQDAGRVEVEGNNDLALRMATFFVRPLDSDVETQTAASA